MNISDQLLGLFNGGLSLEELRKYFNDVDKRDVIYKSWLSPTGNDPVFETINSVSGTFYYPPVGMSTRVRMTGAASIPNATATVISFNQSIQDDLKCFDVSVPDQLIVPVSGRYAIAGNAQWQNSTTGYRIIYAYVVGSVGSLQDSMAPGSFNPKQYIYDEVSFTAGSVLQFYALQGSGGALNLINATLTLRLLRTLDSEVL